DRPEVAGPGGAPAADHRSGRAGAVGAPSVPAPHRRPRPPLPLPQPPLGDGVVRLRPWRPADAPALVAAWSDRDVARWSPPPRSHALVDARRWIDATPRLRERGLALDLVIAAVGPGDRVLGEVGLSDVDDDRAIIGYWVGAADRGRGHATRAVRLMSTWALRHLGLSEVTATVDPANRASLAVLRRAGFTAEAPERWVRRRS
ncbi:MAG TPA: GNAT family N-acetyltransferase, partial [Acidimicrobiales bacterium]|nr:GNAT family N-acetyltransferase [Acidimicrobiales bacterium]